MHFQIRELEYILKNITPNSLVIIDELCRSTNPTEGTLLAWNLCEQLACLRGIANNGNYFNESFQVGSSASALDHCHCKNLLRRTTLIDRLAPEARTCGMLAL